MRGQDPADRATARGQGPETNGPREPALDGHLLIDGRLVGTSRAFPSINPANGKPYGHAPDAMAAEGEAAVAAARRAFDTTAWSTDVELRISCLTQLHQALSEHREELREVAIIAYNYPNHLALAKLAPALAAGCTVVLKAAPDTPLTTLKLGELIAEHTAIPAGVVNVLSSSGPEAGERLTTHPDVDVITFTGSAATGRRIMAAASATVKKVLLELGGKSAMVVLDRSRK